MNWRAAIPNALTLGNLACGFCAMIIFFYQGNLIGGYTIYPPLSAVPNSPDDSHVFEVFRQVPWVLILLAAVFDLFDGMAARALGIQSTLGAQLDSLADIVSFGVAPAFLLYARLGSSMVSQGLQDFSLILSLVAVICLPLAAAYRLARFNVEPSASHAHFEGLPTPAAGLIVVSVAYMVVGDMYLSALPYQTITGVIVALAMVSRWPFLSFKGSMTHQLALVGVFATGALVAWLSDYQPWSVLATLVLYAVVSRALIRPIATPHAAQ